VCERTTLTGVPVEPAHPQTAAALAEGSISTRAAATIVRTVDAIDDFVVDDAGPLFEQNLIEFARDHDPETLGRHAHGMKHRLDQDGAYREADRAQRRHDALLEAMKLLFASGQLQTVNGCATTIVLHADLDDFGKGEGVAWTAHGVAVPTNLAKRWLDPEARALMVLLSRTKGIVAYSDKQRLFTEQQRLAMFARDQGCSYWGCDAPIAWTQAHHLRTHGLALGDDRRIPALDSAELG